MAVLLLLFPPSFPPLPPSLPPLSPSLPPPPPEVDSSFHRLSSLLTVHTTKFSVLVSPLRATVLEVSASGGHLLSCLRASSLFTLPLSLLLCSLLLPPPSLPLSPFTTLPSLPPLSLPPSSPSLGYRHTGLQGPLPSDGRPHSVQGAALLLPPLLHVQRCHCQRQPQ